MNAWWWVALAVLLGAGEMLVTTTLLLWASIGAILTALTLWIAQPQIALLDEWAVQVGLFAVFSMAITLVRRSITVRRRRRPDAAGPLNRRAEQLVGRDAEVIDFQHTEGRVTVDGIPWRARLEGGLPIPSPGARVRIVAADGIVVVIRPI